MAFRPLRLVSHALLVAAMACWLRLAAPHFAVLPFALLQEAISAAAWANPGAALRCAGTRVMASLGLSQFWLGASPPSLATSCSSFGHIILACVDILGQIYGLE